MNILNFFFPPLCLACKQEGDWLCKKCVQEINPNEFQVCPLSLQKSPQGRVVPKRADFFLDGLTVFASYRTNPLLQKLIKQLKYFWASDAVEIFRPFLLQLLQKEHIHLDNYALTFVPLHWRRFGERGFNQSKLLATCLGETERMLKRIRYTQQQAKLSKIERDKNMQDAFKFIGKTVPEKVLLVDDVASTCSTLNECAKVLKKAGVKEVIGVVLARNT